MSNNRNNRSTVPAPEQAEAQAPVVPAVKQAEAQAPVVPEVEAGPAVEEKQPSQKKSGKVNVVATRPGYFKGSRKAEGDKFTLDDASEMGDWMKKI